MLQTHLSRRGGCSTCIGPERAFSGPARASLPIAARQLPVFCRASLRHNRAQHQWHAPSRRKQLVVRAESAPAAPAAPWQTADARLVLQDGSVWKGKAFGATDTEIGEVVFNTSITGYEEIMTDPSYRGQFVVFTHPHIGNVGINLGKSFKFRLTARSSQPAYISRSYN